ncbi:MAG: metallopeptidase family protein [Terriglobales bacterium]
MPVRVPNFDAMVESALRNVPAEFRSRLDNIALVVEEEPSAALLEARGVGPGGTLLGLYEGQPLTARSVFDPFRLPGRITIFQGPHERMARDHEHLERLVEQTLWHEIAHHLGMDEHQVRAAERGRRARHLWPH